MSESMADFEKEIDESLKTLNVVENEGESTEEETGFNAWDKVQIHILERLLKRKLSQLTQKRIVSYYL